MKKHLGDERVEALAFDYLHFYGNANTIAWAPGWDRRGVRIIRNTLPAWSSDALAHHLVDGHKKSRLPRAAHTDATIYHYGWLKTAAQLESKKNSNSKHWGKSASAVDYSEIDPQTLRRF